MSRSLNRPISQSIGIYSRSPILMRRTVKALRNKELIKERFANRTQLFLEQEKNLQTDVDYSLPIATSKFTTMTSNVQQESEGKKIENISTTSFFGPQKPVPKKESFKEKEDANEKEDAKGENISTTWSPYTPGAA